ncbi:MAG: putative glycoside hydrolase [Planctomycetota bacterium]
MNNWMIPMLGSAVVLAGVMGCGDVGVAQDAPRRAGAEIKERGIPMFTSVRTAISDEDWRHVASRYDLVMTLFSPTAGGKDLSGENERVKWVKSLNPNLTMLVYGSVINASNVRLHAWRQPQEHPEWFLKNEAGDWVCDHEYGGALHLDPGNAEWQEYMATAYKDYIARYGYDGAFVDLVISTTHYVNFRKTGKAVNPKTGKPYTDAEWKEATLGLLRTVRRHIGDKLMIVNGSRGADYFRTGYADFLSVADGMCNEGFTGWMQDPTNPRFVPEENWKADVDALADCARRGKIVLAVGNVKKREDAEPAEPYDRLYRYIAASFLLGMGERHYLMFYAKVHGRPECYSPGDEVLPAVCNVSLGKPKGNYYQADGVYQRDFERGKALVNSTTREATVKLKGAWKTPEAKPVVSPLVLPPHTGAILLQEKKGR